MVQKEVGDRLSARAGTPEYGALTVGVSLTCVCERLFDLSETSFDPPPKVRSTVVKLTRRPAPLTDDIPSAQRVIQAAFQQRRKIESFVFSEFIAERIEPSLTRFEIIRNDKRAPGRSSLRIAADFFLTIDDASRAVDDRSDDARVDRIASRRPRSRSQQWQ